MCFMPIAARVLMSFSWLSFRVGMIGSMRMVVAMPFLVSVSAVCMRWVEVGACGSSCLAVASSSVVIVMETIEGTRLSRSMSRVTRVDFVIICSLQLLWARISRVLRVRRVLVSAVG